MLLCCLCANVAWSGTVYAETVSVQSMDLAPVKNKKNIQTKGNVQNPSLLNKTFVWENMGKTTTNGLHSHDFIDKKINDDTAKSESKQDVQLKKTSQEIMIETIMEEDADMVFSIPQRTYENRLQPMAKETHSKSKNDVNENIDKVEEYEEVLYFPSRRKGQ